MKFHQGMLNLEMILDFQLFDPLFYCTYNRGRKRYVSEGDGGAIKLPED